MYVYLNSLLFSNKCKPHQYTNGLDNGAGNNNAFCDDLKCIYPPPPTSLKGPDNERSQQYEQLGFTACYHTADTAGMSFICF